MFFPLGLSNFWVGAWFPCDEGQFNQHHLTLETFCWNDISLSRKYDIKVTISESNVATYREPESKQMLDP